ncbi:bifunctional glycosyltransferase/CDP-glycerol:glycerophosphate glycerophosphotransferase [Butyrivibrio sp. AC2005]|uniref:bifunctional glycosyltransferase/CDP-glycerol:glycerophosphate glycerophosphotransferase n=1 Tax=Butyrivibrio sp. AC2005 TaxID=1280672 RepID=UPI0003F5B089|nr:glycosyltransferase [Butyrivibrio sp. AC2005]
MYKSKSVFENQVRLNEPDISIIVPLYKGINFIEESIKSIQSQTHERWELIIVSEFGNDDGSDDIIKDYAALDNRIEIIKNTDCLGLAESLNVGIKAAKGKYIARVDVDDPSYPERLQKQYEFMEDNADVFLCGTLTRSVLPNTNYILNAPCDYEALKARLLFGCEISHCSIMFRRCEWLEAGYKYDAKSLCEDYDLWTRIMFEKKIVNIPEVLVDHRWGFENISIQKGDRLLAAAREVSRRTIFNAYGISIPDEDLYLCSGWRSLPKEQGRVGMSTFIRVQAHLISNLEEANNKTGLIDREAFSHMLYERFNWCCDSCDIFYRKFSYEEIYHQNKDEQNQFINTDKPLVSIVMPVANSVRTIRETIDSIILQDYSNWEFIIICEEDCNDGSFEIAEFYSRYDKRIRVVKNKENLGLAGSLNYGINISNGKYIARIDADDLANRKRIECQVEYMESHPYVGMCQCYQHYFGHDAEDFIHRPECSADGLKAKLLFFCDACHSTVFLRREALDKYSLQYNTASVIEDYDLWTRLIRVSDAVTLPEVYGEYRVSYSNISREKEALIQSEMCRITARQLKDNLAMNVADEDMYVLGGYVNTVFSLSDTERQNALATLKRILFEAWDANNRIGYYDKAALLKAIALKWRWANEGISWHEPINVSSINSIFNNLSQIVNEDNTQIRKKVNLGNIISSMCIKPLKLIQRANLHLFAANIEHLSNVTKDVSNAQYYEIDGRIEHWTWDRYKRIEERLSVLESENKALRLEQVAQSFERNKVVYRNGDKLRIVFLYQIPSIWISWKSFYEACLRDSRIDCHLFLLEETGTEKSQMNGAREFLEKNSIEYDTIDTFSISEFRPHVLVIQTPYDNWHRKENHRSGIWKSKGIRLVYIPYGIEISDTEDSHRLHFEEETIFNCWRIFTFSDVMKGDYRKYCMNDEAVRVTGLPRMDFYHENLGRNAKSGAVNTLVWKVHFPKWIMESGKRVFVTPDLYEYLKFAKTIRRFTGIHIVFMPHPKFLERSWGNEVNALTSEIVNVLSSSGSAEIFTGDDYWNKLIDADYIITDRSSVMVEAGALDVPVLYMTNHKYDEPVTDAIAPLMNAYYKGTTCEDMVNFVEKCMEGRDPLKAVRERMFSKCIPYYDGEAGERIKDEIIQAIIEEDIKA